jgi:hypothetical protein
MSPEPSPSPAPGTSKDSPLYMRLVTTDGQLDLGKIILMLAVTALSGFLAARSQRAGADPDVLRSVRMRAALASQRACQAQADFWQRAATSSAQAYQKARP